MKKLFALMMCLSLALIAGCSDISREEYEALVEKNSRLESDWERILTEKNKLAQECEKLKSENAELEKRVEGDNSQSLVADNIDIDVLSWIMGRPQSTVVSSEAIKETDWLTTETISFAENSDISVKVVHTIDRSISAEMISSFIHSYELEQAAKIPEMFSKTSNVVDLTIIYRYDDGKIIMTTCWYNYQNNTTSYGYSWGRYGKDVEKEFTKS